MSHTNVVAPVDVCLKPKVGKFGRWKLLSISFLIAWHIEEKILALAFHCGHNVYSMVMGLTIPNLLENLVKLFMQKE